MRLKLVYGSDTGNTENVIDNYLLSIFEPHFEIETISVSQITPEDWESHDFYILSIPTWYDGELQSDWEDYFEEFQTIDFTGKTVAVFGLGDQIGYDEWFCDGVGILAKVVEEKGGKVIGHTEKDDSFDFETSKALKDENTFWGLCLDEDNQDELTEERLENWFNKLKLELNV
jgi:flavodoxin I|tara:strand:- start:383 stop:901 length:519 start_codon:yes stop_codon:yes gene_type:complete